MTMKAHPEWSRPMTADERADRKAEDHVVGHVLDPNVVYPLWLAKLGYPTDKPTQGQLEVARICATTYLKRRGRFVAFVEETVTDPAARAAILSNPSIVDPAKYVGRAFAQWIVWKKDPRWMLANFDHDAPVVGRDVSGAVPHAANAEYERLKREGKIDL